jgi:type I restriction enzyme S subunit
MYVRLGEICDFQSGGTPSKNNQKFFDGDIPWITTVALKGLGIDGSDAVNWITEEAIKQSAAKIVPANSIMIGTRVGVGKVAINLVDMSTSQDIVSLIGIDETRWCKEYLCKCLIGKSQYLNSQARGATIKGIKIDTLANLKIPEISIEKQYEVSRIIDKTRIIIEQRKQELMNLNELMKARFVEMFGDMYLNSKGWPEAKLESMADVVSGITKGRKTKAEDLTEVPYMAVSNVKDGYIDWTTVKTIEATQQEIEQYRLLADDVLMTEGGDPDKVGRGAIIKEPLENCIHQNHIFRVRLDESMILPEFFAEYLQHQRSKRYFLGCAKQTTGIASINMTQLRALPVLMPPLSKQEEFVLFKAQVNKSKFEEAEISAHI